MRLLYKEEAWMVSTRLSSSIFTGAKMEALGQNTRLMGSSTPWRCVKAVESRLDTLCLDMFERKKKITSNFQFFSICRCADGLVPNGHPLSFNLQLHIVHMSEKYTSLSDALKDPSGVAVLGFFYEVSLQNNTQHTT